MLFFMNFSAGMNTVALCRLLTVMNEPLSLTFHLPVDQELPQ